MCRESVCEDRVVWQCEGEVKGVKTRLQLGHHTLSKV